ncbi:MAG: hypothetical protein HOE90_15240 [Bacteriovoracaceae bacterium]|nr:hypothetical protein [Bacteriovoracaceae bacterium]
MRKLAFLSLLLLPNLSFASFPEMFGASASTSSFGSQASSDVEEPANNYYAPALLGFSRNVNLGVSTYLVNTYFEEIKNVTVENTWTRSSLTWPNGKHDVDVNDGVLWMNAIHASLPILKPTGPKIGFSLFAPGKYIMEVNSGDPFNPEYVMYRSRYKRAQAFFNISYAFTDNLAVSIGAYNGFQVSMDLYTYARVGADKSGYSSWARSKAQAKPTLAGIASIAYKERDWDAYFTLVQEMKSKLKGKAGGASDDPSVPFAIELNSLAFYDPMTLRFGGHLNLAKIVNLQASLEWQKWDNYRPPIAHLKQDGGVIVSSKILETLDLRNIFVPKLGVNAQVTDSMKLGSGLIYRQTPLKGNFSGSANSIDFNTWILTGGGSLEKKFFGQTFEGSLGMQYHKLEKKNITKSTGREDGSSGDKVGTPGYKGGGHILVGTMGLTMKI